MTDLERLLEEYREAVESFLDDIDTTSLVDTLNALEGLYELTEDTKNTIVQELAYEISVEYGDRLNG